MNLRVDLGAGAVVGGDDQRVLGRSRVILRDRLDPRCRVFHFMDAALPLQSSDRFTDLASGELLDHGVIVN
jgi:hypothetical protein